MPLSIVGAGSVQRLTFAREGTILGFRLAGGTVPGHPLIVADVMPLSAAYRAGLRKGQRVVQINSASALDKTAVEIGSLLKDPSDKPITVHVVTDSHDSDV